jgi:hypothetical protein
MMKIENLIRLILRRYFWIVPLFMMATGLGYYGLVQDHHRSVMTQAPPQRLPVLSPDMKVKSLIKKNLNDIMDCYNERLEHGLEGEGDLQISWEINGRGQAAHFAEIKNELQDSELYDCSAEAISQWKFPVGHAFVVHYTFHLKQKNHVPSAAHAEKREVASSDSLSEAGPLPPPAQNHDAKGSQ